jgi:hypothetical protein
MVKERFYGPGDPFWGWRCPLCGEIFDSLIWENRKELELVEKGRNQRETKGVKHHDYPERRRNPEIHADGGYF